MSARNQTALLDLIRTAFDLRNPVDPVLNNRNTMTLDIIGRTSSSSSLLAPPAKRKRFSINNDDTQTSSSAVPSTIVDSRIEPSKALRLSCPPLTIVVGPPDTDETSESTQESFFVHEHALVDRSPFIANIMKPEWSSQRADPRVITLEDDDPAAFALYVTWLYSGKLPILPEKDEHNSITPNDSLLENEGYATLAHAYILGERLMDALFKNAICDAYVLYARGSPPAKRLYPTNEDIRLLYEGTNEKSPIRRLLVDIWCCRGRYEWIEHDDDLPKDFLIEVTKALLKCRPSTDHLSRPWKNSHEQYYEKQDSQGNGGV